MVPGKPHVAHGPGALTPNAPARTGGTGSERPRLVAGAGAAAPEADESRKPAERAYQGIRRAILTGELKSGDHLREEQLARLTGTSRTPVREALRRLVAEGLATVENRHRYVTDFPDGEVAIIFDLRAKLESYAAGVAAQTINEIELKRLARLIDAIDEIDDDGSDDAVDRFLTLNTEFHRLIVEASRSRQLQVLTAQATALPLVLIKQFVCDQRINIVRSNEQHRDILAALSRRNSQWAQSAMHGHVISTKPHPAAGGGRR